MQERGSEREAGLVVMVVRLRAVEGARLPSEQLEFKPYLCLAGPTLRSSR